jgi:hypothetical protein
MGEYPEMGSKGRLWGYLGQMSHAFGAAYNRE